MQRGYAGFPFPTGKPINAPSAGLTTAQSSTGMKASIVVFDVVPGTRSWTVPAGVFKIRTAAIGAGGGPSGGTGACGGYSEKVLAVLPGQVFSYTVGAGLAGTNPGGTSSFGGIISASGGAAGISGAAAGGVGSGGDVNTNGGNGSASGGAGSSGHRFGNGVPAGGSTGGHGWTGAASVSTGGNAGVDGFGLGLVPGQGGANGVPGGYGAGGGAGAAGGLGGGIGVSSGTAGGTGAVSGTTVSGGNGGVIVEILQ